ncbi:MAG TPA: MBL fold metallo-hydrolase [Sphingomonadaceae bacterium]|nr:MBL fold metallo-hydrolase [Sphingomonadaceae bacterium]
MKRFAVLSAIVAGGITAATVMAQGLPGPEPIEKISDNLYKIFGGGGNTTVFIRDDGVVLVDTKVPGNGEAILAEVRKVTDLPVTLIVNTHSHPDHLGSNAFFRENGATVDIVTHRNAAASASSGPFANPAGAANITYDKFASLGTGRNRVDLHYFGPAHTNGDTFVVFPSERAMVTGDVMAWDMGAVIDTASGGSALEMPATLDRAVQAFEGNIDTVIEGHGKVDDWQTFLGYVGYTHKIVEVARKGVAEGLNYVEAYDKYFATDPRMSAYTGENLMKGLEYGGTPKTRTLNNLFIAMEQLKGVPVPLTMMAPPPPAASE